MDLTVHHVELSVMGQQQFFVATVETPDGRGWMHIMPSTVFESRAAEYGIDPTTDEGWQDVLDMVFYERFVPAGDELNDPDWLLNAPTVARAREAKLEKINEYRGAGRLIGVPGTGENRMTIEDATTQADSGDECPLAFMRRTAPISREHMRVKQEYTRRSRNAMRARRAGRRVGSLQDAQAATRQARADMAWQRESADELAERLLGPTQTETGLPPRESEIP